MHFRLHGLHTAFDTRQIGKEEGTPQQVTVKPPVSPYAMPSADHVSSEHKLVERAKQEDFAFEPVACSIMLSALENFYLKSVL